MLLLNSTIVHKLLTTLAFCIIILACVSAQKVSISVIASGGNYGESLGGMSLTYTFGECAIKTLKVNSFEFTEGFNQGKVSSNPDTFVVNNLEVFPNPVTEEVNYILHVRLPVKNEINSYIIYIYSLTGKLMVVWEKSNLLYGITKDFDFSKYAKGMYLVKIQSPDGPLLKTFKIIKK